MTETVADNLWGDHLGSLQRAVTPRSILEQQAAILTEATKGRLVGSIDDRSHEKLFLFDFDIVVPPLNNYRYTLLTVQHEIELYPANIIAHKPASSHRCDDEIQYRAVLADILQGESTQRVLTNLLSQVPA